MPSSTQFPNASTNGRTFSSFREIADFLWQNAERLRGTYKPNEYDKVILPMLVFRRMDCVLAPTKEKVLARLADLKTRKMKESDPATEASLKRTARLRFFNTSRLDFAKLRADPASPRTRLPAPASAVRTAPDSRPRSPSGRGTTGRRRSSRRRSPRRPPGCTSRPSC